jgi:holo-[acyl-carrier protein] synthase
VIVGIGVDIADISRLGEALRRTPALAARLFAKGEQGGPVSSLAACFAANEAVAKAPGGAGS